MIAVPGIRFGRKEVLQFILHALPVFPGSVNGLTYGIKLFIIFRSYTRGYLPQDCMVLFFILTGMKMNKMIVLSVLVILVAIAGCTHKPAAREVFSGKDMDLTVNPGENFYQYSNGGWMKNHPLPDEKSRYGSFDILAEENRKQVKGLIEESVAKNGEPGSVSRKIGDFFASGMDTIAIENQGIQFLLPLLARVDNVTDKAAFFKEVGYLQSILFAPLLNLFSAPDSRNSKMVIASIGQGGLGLPDRDYYTEKGEREDKIREAYKNYLKTIFTLSGSDEATGVKAAETVLAFETRLAIASNTRLENRDPQKTYNKMTYKQLKALAPAFDWDLFFSALPISTPSEFDVNQPRFISEMAREVEKAPLDILKTYLKATVIRQSADGLTKAFVDANFELYEKTLSGKKAQEPRWKTMVNATNGVLGEAVGQLYVERYFPPQAKTRIITLIENLREAFGQRIDQLTWMSDTTKKAARGKLAAITVKVGYPNKWRDFNGLEIKRNEYLSNLLSSNAFEFKYMMAKAGKPVDKEEWEMTPQTVNAYYNPLANEIVFPAAILQPPFFFPDGDDAINYGAIGVVIGHEMTHGFDDQGRQFDKEGNLTDWWKASDNALFNQKKKVLADLFNTFTVLDTVKANGELTLGENIADLGGIFISYQAYQNTLKDRQEPPELEGFTGNQRFFLSYSRVWAQNIRNEAILRLTREDVHSIGAWRVNGPLPNFQPWYDAFGITETAKMYIAPEKRAAIW
jgi:putative endopeptidase